MVVLSTASAVTSSGSACVHPCDGRLTLLHSSWTSHFLSKCCCSPTSWVVADAAGGVASHVV